MNRNHSLASLSIASLNSLLSDSCSRILPDSTLGFRIISRNQLQLWGWGWPQGREGDRGDEGTFISPGYTLYVRPGYPWLICMSFVISRSTVHANDFSFSAMQALRSRTTVSRSSIFTRASRISLSLIVMIFSNSLELATNCRLTRFTLSSSLSRPRIWSCRSITFSIFTSYSLGLSLLFSSSYFLLIVVSSQLFIVLYRASYFTSSSMQTSQSLVFWCRYLQSISRLLQDTSSSPPRASASANLYPSSWVSLSICSISISIFSCLSPMVWSLSFSSSFFCSIVSFRLLIQLSILMKVYLFALQVYSPSLMVPDRPLICSRYPLMSRFKFQFSFSKRNLIYISLSLLLIISSSSIILVFSYASNSFFVEIDFSNSQIVIESFWIRASSFQFSASFYKCRPFHFLNQSSENFKLLTSSRYLVWLAAISPLNFYLQLLESVSQSPSLLTSLSNPSIRTSFSFISTSKALSNSSSISRDTAGCSLTGGEVQHPWQFEMRRVLAWPWGSGLRVSIPMQLDFLASFSYGISMTALQFLVRTVCFISKQSLQSQCRSCRWTASFQGRGAGCRINGRQHPSRGGKAGGRSYRGRPWSPRCSQPGSSCRSRRSCSTTTAMGRRSTW